MIEASIDEDEETEETLKTKREQEYVPSYEICQSDPYPLPQKKKEIVTYFRSNKKKLKTIKQMQRRYPKLNNLRTLYNWERTFRTGSLSELEWNETNVLSRELSFDYKT